MHNSNGSSFSYDPRNIPAYSFADAARYLGIPAATIGTWLRGRLYHTKQGQRRSEPLIKIPNKRVTNRRLSFTNLVEAHVLRAIRTVHGISMDKVREALDFVERELNYQNPLVRAEFRTDGVDLFVNHLGQLVSASTKERSILHKSLLNHLDRIESDDSKLAQKLFPFGSISADLEGESSVPKTVVIDPRIAFGRLVLVGTGIPTAIVAERYKFGEGIDDLADDYSCKPSLIEEAIRWELPIFNVA